MLKEEAHSQRLAEASIGLGVDNGKTAKSTEELQQITMEDV